MTTLEHASREWSSRPADERFSSLESMRNAAHVKRMNSVTRPGRLDAMKVIQTSDDVSGLQLVGKQGVGVDFSNWSFGQFSKMVGAPPSYVSTLPAKLAAECLNEGLSRREASEGNDDVSLLIDQSGNTSQLRSINSDSYTRFHNDEIIEGLMGLESRYGIQPAPAAFDGSRGLYMGDRDMFAFMVDNDRRIFETLPGGGLSRGFFLANSEVGARSLWLMTFLYEFVCGNHRVWGAKVLDEVRVRHVGDDNLRKAMTTLRDVLPNYVSASAREDEDKINALRMKTIGSTKEEVTDTIFGMKIAGLTRKVITASVNLAEVEESKYGDPRSVWGITGAMTQIARDLPNADSRTELETASRKLMESVF
jgi:hypothetical protein